MKNKIVIKIKPEDIKVRNELHFNVQLHDRAHVFKSKKGRGSYTRKSKHKNDLQ